MVVKRRGKVSLGEVIRVLESRIPDLQARYGLTALGVFGSYVTGRERADSDLDVLVEFDEGRDPRGLDSTGLQDELTELLGVTVDLGERRLLKPYIGRQVARQVLWLLGRNEKGEAPRREMNMAREYLDFLNDVVLAADQVERFIAGVSFQDLAGDELRTMALAKAIENMGEAAKRIPEEVRASYPEIPWRDMTGTRDNVAHGYFAVDLGVLWRISTVILPPLAPALRAMRDAEVQRREADDGPDV